MRKLLISLLIVAAGCSSSDPSDWNRREKGTAIGGVGGAALGGIIGSQSGNAGAGALLGGAAGAGAGYLVGREQDDDRDDDRYSREREDRY